MKKIVHASKIPLWQRQALLKDWVQWVVIKDGYIDGGYRTREDANKPEILDEA